MIVILLLLSLLGFFDATYLTYEHFSGTIPPCTINQVFSDCGKVLSSSYSAVYGIPLSLFGSFHYALEIVVFFLILVHNRTWTKRLALILTTVGFLFSAYFVYLQLFIIHAICPYCMASALISFLLFILVHKLYPNHRKYLTASVFSLVYLFALKPLFFLLDPEFIHESMTLAGRTLGNSRLSRYLTSTLLLSHHAALGQTLFGHHFASPIGLAAGFDYETRLPGILPSLGFGFQAIGTITSEPYAGNPKPRLGRLPKSKSLMVNKGFKNPGMSETIKRLSAISLSFPVGISIGTVKNSITDICNSFAKIEKARLNHAYYELNISCPNIHTTLSFYQAKNLNELLYSIDNLKLKKPVFIKMPINESNANTLSMLKVISKHKVTGVIFGNLQKDRSHPALNQSEVAKFPAGNFSGRPCFDRSNELISLTHKHFKNKLLIIGCGGVFTASDAYEKIIRGASLVQMVTGLIYQGPQVATQINFGLESLLKANGFSSLSQAIGTKKL